MHVTRMGTVLVVDDHSETRRPLVRLLQLDGYQAQGASNAFEALGIVNAAVPDLILLDVMIPPMDGLTFLMRLREDARSREVPVIVVSGLSDPQTIARAQELGVRAHLVKTQFTTEQLLEAVRLHIRPGAPPTPKG
jgi:CheY-like chemotaxis protein